MLTKPTQQNLKFPKEWTIGYMLVLFYFMIFFILIKAEKTAVIGLCALCLCIQFTVNNESILILFMI